MPTMSINSWTIKRSISFQQEVKRCYQIHPLIKPAFIACMTDVGSKNEGAIKQLIDR